jgi:subtilisin family serine protease
MIFKFWIVATILVSLLHFSGADSAGDGVSYQLAHSAILIRSSSFAVAVDDHHYVQLLNDAAAAAAAASLHEQQELADNIFHKAKFAVFGSHVETAPAHFYQRSLASQEGDRQFFVAFSTRSDVRTLLALQKFTGSRVFSHIHGDLYAVIGGSDFAAKARLFPGVSWAQEREGASKLGSSLQQSLHEAGAAEDRGGVFEVVAECWYDGCAAAAAAVRRVCPDVYLHPSLVEMHCRAGVLPAAVAVLANHIAVDFVDIKPSLHLYNYGGKTIISKGPSDSTPGPSHVLSLINTSASIIAVADSGIDMNNCFFYDGQPGWIRNSSRVVSTYAVQSCEMCGRCCGNQSGPKCTNASNACGNYIDQSGHGTHVVGTVAGSGPPEVQYGNGIAMGAKIFFQDIENIQSNDTCFTTGAGGCMSLSAPSDMFNLFTPAFQAGARVHSNSWGPATFNYTVRMRQTDEFISSNPTFLVLFAAGNNGISDPNRDLGSVTNNCKNCLIVGASQQSDALFRTMSPFVDDSAFCPIASLLSNRSNGSLAVDPCCANPLSCVGRCCNWTSPANMSLTCCAEQTTCGGMSSCSVESGNIRSATNVAAFSSRGPTPDGRFKPDLVAPGEDVLSAATPDQRVSAILGLTLNVTSANHCGVPNRTAPRSAQDNLDIALKVASGTSMATPLMAGAVEKIRQYFVQGYYPAGKPGSGTCFEPEEALVRAVVLASCVSVTTDPSWGLWSQRYPLSFGFFRFPLPPALSPSFFHGFGLPVLDQAVYMANSTNNYTMLFVNMTYTSESAATAFNVTCNASLAHAVPLTLALVWTDPPGSTNSMKQLVNDLDLIVVLPGASPPQLFGNMRAFADQSNTVERVVTECPPEGVVTAIIALGDSLKTASQAWYLVANGPVMGIVSAAVPPHSTGRSEAPAFQPYSCMKDAVIVAIVQFKSSSTAWSCGGAPGRLSCSVKKRVFVSSLAQIAGVAVQAITVLGNNATSLLMALQCSAAISSWSIKDQSTSLKYVSAPSLFAAIRNTSNMFYDADAVLSGFDWSTFVNISTIASTNSTIPSTTPPATTAFAPPATTASAPPATTAFAPPDARSADSAGALTYGAIAAISIGCLATVIVAVLVLAHRKRIAAACLRLFKPSQDIPLSQNLMER